MKNLLLVVGLFCFAGLDRPAFAQLAYSEPEWYLPTGDQDCRLFVQEYGRGKETIVIVHGGWGAEHSYLLDAFKGLEERYHLVFYDQRGSLRSPCPSNMISTDKHVVDLERLRSALGIERMNLVAHSMGTFLAMDYLQHHPDHVKGLVFLGVFTPRSYRTPAERAIWVAQERAKEAFIDRPEVTAELRKQGLDKDPATLSAQDETNNWRIRFAGANLYHVERWRQKKGGRAFYNEEAGEAAAKTMPQQYDFTDALAAHPCPIWIVVGDHDYADFGNRAIKLITSGIASVRLEVIKEAGHDAWIDAPQEFAKLLASAADSSTQCIEGSE